MTIGLGLVEGRASTLVMNKDSRAAYLVEPFCFSPGGTVNFNVCNLVPCWESVCGRICRHQAHMMHSIWCGISNSFETPGADASRTRRTRGEQCIFFCCL